MTIWRDVHVGGEGDDLKIGGVAVWKEKWRQVKSEPPLQLPYPGHPKQTGRFLVYEVGDAAHPVRFAATELSAGVFGFYVPA